jgi:hypothetical protein
MEDKVMPTAAEIAKEMRDAMVAHAMTGKGDAFKKAYEVLNSYGFDCYYADDEFHKIMKEEIGYGIPIEIYSSYLYHTVNPQKKHMTKEEWIKDLEENMNDKE